MPPVPKTFDNELGRALRSAALRGRRAGTRIAAFSIDYARYNFYNIGFRTGLNVFVDEDAENYFSVPLQFTWADRTYRLVLAPGEPGAERAE